MTPPVTDPRKSTPAVGRSLDPLRVIALFKFLKAAALIATGYGVHLLLNQSLLQRIRDWTFTLTDSLAQRLLQSALGWVESLGAKRIHIVMAVTLSYTAVVLTEGIGLWLRRAWAEWLTVVATASLIPFELWELITRQLHRTLPEVATLIVNITIVWYLARLLQNSAAQRAHQFGNEAQSSQTSRRSTG